MIDMQQAAAVDTVIAIPPATAAAQARSPEDIKEAVTVGGSSSAGRILSITGTADQEPCR